MKEDYRYIIVIAVTIFIYGAANIFFAIKYNEPFYYVWTAFCFPTVIGLLLNKNWSKYLVYLLSFATTSGWAYFTYTISTYGWSQYDTEYKIKLIALGVFLITASILFSTYAHKYFKQQP